MIHKVKVKFCKDCRHSAPEERSEWNLVCRQPDVNRKDYWALSASSAEMSGRGTGCSTERGKKWFAACGIKGKKWEPKQ